MEKKLLGLVNEAFNEKRRIIAPLIGFPGINIVGSTIKLAQQNHGEHFKVLKAIYETFEPDLIFPLMDLSVEANALGRLTIFPKEESATVVKDEFILSEIEKLDRIDIAFDSRVTAYVETIKLLQKSLSPKMLIGAYVTGPYTLAALIMGAEDAAISTILNPDELHNVCTLATKKVLDYVRLLISAGAQIICILEPSAVMLGPTHFNEFSAKYVSTIAHFCNYSNAASVYHICGNTMHLVEAMAESGVDALSLDSAETGVSLPEVAEKIPKDVVIIGNISPIRTLLRGKPSDVQKEVLELLKSMRPYPNFILSTGCDLPQETPLENIHAFMRTGKNYRII